MSTASIMFVANLTLGLYVQFGPRSLTPNGTVGLEIMTLGDTEQSPATSFNYLTLIPLLATMLFIMGRNTLAVVTPGMGCWGAGGDQGSITVLVGLRGGGAGKLGLLTTQETQARQLEGPQVLSPTAPLSGQAMPWAGGPSPGSSCLRSCPCVPAVLPRGSACWSAGSQPSSSPSTSCWRW